ncbi:hypothetical protein MmiAt1_06540 [Methanimicrococcus sp. At1]|uniref:Peptidase U32 collagenase domain-containing protein n=1 Tax=Methanimicrococcus hacksteinii TaxID=3028293 RepID=A0ABU3VNW5_9EURY|nr:U32 family peptidase [Methanimicrococcus sp. At1]MDV0445097.1 hypothetical protein [Methanimicrococcus sp. At1]
MSSSDSSKTDSQDIVSDISDEFDGSNLSDASDTSDVSDLSPPELLAPAGTFLSLIAAVQNGADAVYMGASRFSARAYAGNFSDSELAAGIDYAHAFGKKVYVTLNTLYKDDELDDVMLLLDELYCRGVDSVIVQDLGLLFRAASRYPDFAVHASTQMTVHNSYHASFLQKHGVSRVVPARENSIPELAEIKKTGVEVETFVHGALCICYSGQCLFSSLVGSRSGNRGKCAQPCRKRYTLLVRGKPVFVDGQYLLSPKDLNASETLKNLIQAGVDSFKIEGRMKKPEYVAGVVSVYRNLIDRIISEQNSGTLPTPAEEEKLLKLFNRGFTGGYFFKNPKNDLMSRKLPYNKGIPVGKITQTDRRNSNISVLLESELSAHDGISIGDIGKNMNSTEDPRIGFTVKKMYVGRKICSKAGPGDTVEIPMPPAEYGSKFPAAGDSVYKTFDFELQKDLLKTFPAAATDEERTALIEETVLSAYGGSSSCNLSAADSSAVSPADDSSVVSPADSLSVPEMIEKLSPSESIQIPVSFDCKLTVGMPILITASDSEGLSVSVSSDYIIEPAQKNPFSKEQASDLLFKLGGTIWQTQSADVSVSGDCFVPVGEFKNARNKVLQALLNERIVRRQRQLPGNLNSNDSNKASGILQTDSESDFPAPEISVCVYSKEGLFAALNAGADRIYAGGDLFKDPVSGVEFGLTAEDLRGLQNELSASDLDNIFFKTPSVTKENDFVSLKQNLEILKETGISGILASNVGVYEFIQSDSDFADYFKIAIDLSFNIFNSNAADFFFGQGVSSVIVSPELSISEIDKLIQSSASAADSFPVFECCVHGRQRLMITEHPLLQSLLAGKSFSSPQASAFESESETASDFKTNFGSNSESVSLSDYMLKDSKNYQFPVLTDAAGRNHLFNSKELNAFDLLSKIRKAGISCFRIDGIGHTSEEIFSLVKSYKTELSRIDHTAEKTDGKMIETAETTKTAKTENLSENRSEDVILYSQDGSEYTKGNFLRSTD